MRRLGRFALVGGSGYVLNLSVFAALHQAGAPRLAAAVGAFGVAVSSNFWLNHSWTFQGQSSHHPHGQAWRFLVVSLGAFAVTAAVLELTARVGVPALAAEAVAIVGATPISFLAHRAWTFAAVAPIGAAATYVEPSTTNSSLWLVVPTYNEAANLEPFVRAVLAELAASARNAHLLVVDDNSPDGTGAIADRMASEHPNVEVLHRESKDGLGRAYLAGFDYALREGADLVMEMDADFSHDPHDIPRLVATTRLADVAIGSRYIDGGSIPEWSVVRRLLSRLGCRYARTVLHVPVRDLTGGFKCFRRSVLEQIDLADVRNDGYGFQIELTYRALQAGFRTHEVPIAFGERRAGDSKMNARIAMEALWKVPALRLHLDRRPRTRRLPLPADRRGAW